jgi:hypothetical protein
MLLPDFIPGNKLSRRLYLECVQPILQRHFPRLRHAAALWGYGSEVLGFDTPISRDHDWGPRMQVFLSDEDSGMTQAVWTCLAQQLPHQFHGYSTHFGPPNEEDNGTRHMADKDSGPVDHRVEVTTLVAYLGNYLPVDVLGEMSAADWLVIPQQKLRTIAAAPVHADGLGTLLPLQDKLRWYPDAVWHYLLASAWSRLGQEEHLVGRCGHTGDELGASLLGASLTRTIMQLAFWMEKQYAPYPKWFGSAFRQLRAVQALAPHLEQVRLAADWQARDRALADTYTALLHQWNMLGLIDPVDTAPQSFFGRPFQVIYAGKIAEKTAALLVGTPLANFPLIGNIDLITDSTDVVEKNDTCYRMKALYATGA